VDKPGTHFVYSTGFVNIAMLAMRESLGGNAQALYDLYQRELFAPLGIRRGVIEFDASGTPNGGARGILRPVDWLRLGQLVADGGRWNDTQVLPETWVSFMTAASPADDGYGGFMWRAPSANASVRARLPSDAVWFAGHMGQFVVVVPSQRLLVSRMGVALRGDHDEVIDQVLELVIDLLGHK
jgi:CubicO group peptidase (beta-lactamase class C family)